MEEEKNKYLPYGSVVKLKNDSNMYMIIGLQVEFTNKTTQERTYYDYLSEIIPQGYVSEDNLSLFNTDDIENVVFVGYYNEKIKSYYEDIKWSVDRRKKNE